MRGKFFWFFLIAFLKIASVQASEVIVLGQDGLHKEHFFHGQFLDLLEDKSGKLTLEQVMKEPYSNQFRLDDIKVSGSYNVDTYYWARFTLHNRSEKTTGWLIELYDFKIDYFELYIPDGKGGYVKKIGGDRFAFDHREYLHKNFVFDLPELPAGSTQTFYLRVYSEEPIAIIGVVRTIQRFVHYATIEYYLLALFYGVLITIGLYNVLLYLHVRDLSYLFLASYILGFMIHCMSQDGTGFQLFWNQSTMVNNYGHHFFLLVIMVSILLYAKSFLLSQHTVPVVSRWINLFILFRSLLFVLSLLYHDAIFYKGITCYDFLTTFAIFLAGIYSYYIKNYRPAKYYMLAFAFFFMGFFITMMHTLQWLDTGVYLAAYAFHGGAIVQIFFLSLSVGDRMRMLIREKAQLKDKINEELEAKVVERTKELQHKNMQLDSFVYKASHDIKGPLKSIIGLTSVALKDIKDSAAHEYFHHILKSTTRLDTLLHDLLSLTKMQKEVVVQPVRIDLKAMVQDIWFSFRNLPETERMHFEIVVRDQEDFYSDHKLVYSICQNMIENAIKYSDPEKPTQVLQVDIATNASGAEITFSDNGIGIPAEYKEKIFEVFTKVNSYSTGFGLGLHLVQLSLAKLKGKVEVKSKVGEGTSFCVKLPQIRSIKKSSPKIASATDTPEEVYVEISPEGSRKKG